MFGNTPKKDKKKKSKEKCLNNYCPQFSYECSHKNLTFVNLKR